MLELDHVFCIVTDPDHAARRLEDDGWVLDAGQAHRGQGTRNRRLAWREQFFELVWVTDAAEARTNPLRLDRRADWTTTGASPFGLAFRGQIDPAHSDQFWLYDALGPRIWIHRDNERAPERPPVLVLEAGEEEMNQRRLRRSMSAVAHRHPGELREIRVHGPSAPSLPPFAGPPIIHARGSHLLELIVADEVLDFVPNEPAGVTRSAFGRVSPTGIRWPRSHRAAGSRTCWRCRPAARIRSCR